MRLHVLLTMCIVAGLFHATCAAQIASPDSVEIRQHTESAKLALARNDLASAEQQYREILKLDPTNVEVQTALGVTLYGSGKFAEAVVALRRALDLAKNQPRAELFLALSESSAGQCDRAVPVLSNAFFTEHDLKLRHLVGLSLLECQLVDSDLTAAFETVRKLRDSFPDDPDVLYKSAELYTRLWNQAAGELMKKHPESYRVHQLAGEVFEAQERDEQAIKEFRLALAENPRIPDLHFRIGRLIAKQNAENMQEKALSEFREELAINPASAPAEYEIGEVYRARQDSERASQHFQRAIELDPEFAEPHIGMGQVLIGQRQFGKAHSELEAAIRLQPDNASAHYNLMLAYRGEGNAEGASREMAAFQKLQDQTSERFQNKLHSLLTGTAEDGSRGSDLR